MRHDHQWDEPGRLRRQNKGTDNGLDILNNVKKGVRLDVAREFTRNAKRLGIKIHGTFTTGLPGETCEAIEQTIRFARAIDPDTLRVSLAAPYPDAELHRVGLGRAPKSSSRWSSSIAGSTSASARIFAIAGERARDATVAQAPARRRPGVPAILPTASHPGRLAAASRRWQGRAATLLVSALALAGCALLEAGLRPPVTPDQPIAALRGHHGTVTSLAFSADGRRLASGSRDGTVRLWRLPSGEFERALVTPGVFSLWAIAFSPDGMLLASAADDIKIRVWEIPEGGVRAVLEGHANSIRALAWSPDGALLASGSKDNTVRLWEAGWWILHATLPHGNTVRSLAFSRDGATLFSGSAEDVIRAWDVKTRTVRTILRGHTNTVHALATSRDGRALVSGAADRTVRVWNLPRLELRGVLALDRAAEPPTVNERRGLYPGPEVMAVAVSPDVRYAASAHRGSAIRLWDLSTLREIAQIRSPADTSYAVVFSLDGRSLFSGGDDRVVYEWDVAAKLR